MKRTLKYFVLQCKRTLKFLPFVLAVSAVLAVGLAVILRTLVFMTLNDENRQKINVGIVGDAGDTYLGFGIKAIESMDSSKYVMNLVELEENEAKEKLKRNEISAYLVIPENFVDAVVDGENIPQIACYTSSNSVNIISIFKEELLSSVSCMLVESQNGLYALHDVMHESKDYDKWSENINSLNMSYFDLIFGRALLYQVETIGVSDNLSFIGYMFSGISVLMLFLFGIASCFLFVRRDMALPKLMRATGHGSFSQTLGEYSAYFILMTINVCVIVILAMFVVGDSFGTIPDFASMESMSPGSLILALTAPLVLVTSFQFMLYELCDTVVNGVLLQFATTVVLAFVGGCFYPVNFLPDGMQKIASFLPTGMVREYVSEVILGHSVGTKAVVLLGVSALFIAVCVAVRKFKIVNS